MAVHVAKPNVTKHLRVRVTPRVFVARVIVDTWYMSDRVLTFVADAVAAINVVRGVVAAGRVRAAFLHMVADPIS